MPGTAKPDPNGTPRVWVTETTVPVASAQAKWVVCSCMKFAGWPSAICPASVCGLWRSPSLTAARLPSMRARCDAAYFFDRSPASGTLSP